MSSKGARSSAQTRSRGSGSGRCAGVLVLHTGVLLAQSLLRERVALPQRQTHPSRDDGGELLLRDWHDGQHFGCGEGETLLCMAADAVAGALFVELAARGQRTRPALVIWQ